MSTVHPLALAVTGPFGRLYYFDTPPGCEGPPQLARHDATFEPCARPGWYTCNVPEPGRLAHFTRRPATTIIAWELAAHLRQTTDLPHRLTLEEYNLRHNWDDETDTAVLVFGDGPVRTQVDAGAYATLVEATPDPDPFIVDITECVVTGDPLAAVPDGCVWSARLPHAVTGLLELQQAFPGELHGVHQHIEAKLASPHREFFWRIALTGQTGPHCAVTVLMDPSERRAAAKRRKGRPVPDTRLITVPLGKVPDRIRADNLEDAARQLRHLTDEVERVTSLIGTACPTCAGTGLRAEAFPADTFAELETELRDLNEDDDPEDLEALIEQRDTAAGIAARALALLHPTAHLLHAAARS
jgi:hypothetical protein